MKRKVDTKTISLETGKSAEEMLQEAERIKLDQDVSESKKHAERPRTVFKYFENLAGSSAKWARSWDPQSRRHVCILVGERGAMLTISVAATGGGVPNSEHQFPLSKSDLEQLNNCLKALGYE